MRSFLPGIKKVRAARWPVNMQVREYTRTHVANRGPQQQFRGSVNRSPVRCILPLCSREKERSRKHLRIRGGRSHFSRLRLRFCSKIFESGSGSGKFTNLRIRLLSKFELTSIQPKFTHVFIQETTTQTPATVEIENWLRIWVRFFHKIKTLGPDPVAKAKRRILPESTPAIRIHGRLYFVLAGDFAGNYDENTLLLFDRKNALRCSFIIHISSESPQT